MEQLLQTFRSGIKIIELFACIIGFLCWARLFPRFWKSFPIYLLIITVCEFVGWYMNSNQYFRQSTIMYNYFVVPLEFLFMLYLYYNVLPKIFRRTVLVLATAYIIAFLLEYFVLKNTKWIWMSLSYITGSLAILILAVVYILQLISKEKVVQYRKESFFWINLALLLFYVGSFPYYATVNYLYKVNEPLFWALIWIVVILNYVMYTLFIVGFLCFRKPREY